MTLFEQYPHFKAFTTDFRGMVHGFKTIPVWHVMTKRWICPNGGPEGVQIGLDPAGPPETLHQSLQVRPEDEEERERVTAKWLERSRARMPAQELRDGDGKTQTGFSPYG